VALVNGL